MVDIAGVGVDIGEVEVGIEEAVDYRIVAEAGRIDYIVAAEEAGCKVVAAHIAVVCKEDSFADDAAVAAEAVARRTRALLLQARTGGHSRDYLPESRAISAPRSSCSEYPPHHRCCQS